MNYYKASGQYFMSNEKHDLPEITKEELVDANQVYFLKDYGSKARYLFDIDIKDLKSYQEDIQVLFSSGKKQITTINTSYDNWLFHLDRVLEGKWKVNIIALGDVGRTLLTGLKLLGAEVIEEIGIFDLDGNQLERLEMEFNQVLDPFSNQTMPRVKVLSEAQLFDCDMLVFCASKAIPKVGSGVSDVRMAQFSANKSIASYYAKLARENLFKGVFAVVSDPVDLLSRAVFEQSNTNEEGVFDFKGLKPEQVIGYGLGVMNARATYYASKLGFSHYSERGRAYGPHGSDLVIINDLENFDLEISLDLTTLAVNANKEVRAVGFKPYIAPALSSAAIPILNTIKGQYNYSSIFIGGVYYGCKNRLIGRKIEIDTIDFSKDIYNMIHESYSKVDKLYE